MNEFFIEYQNSKDEYKEYFHLVDLLGNFYFPDNNNSAIYLSIDSDQLDRIFHDIKGQFSGEEYLRTVCMNLISGTKLKKQNLFNNLISIYKQWEGSQSKDFPPHLPFVAMFILAATKMGENSETIDWRAYYKQLHKLMDFPKEVTKQNIEKSFTKAFGSISTDETREEMFEKLSNWIELNYPNNKNTFKIGSDLGKHRDWILRQCLFNTKDRNSLPDFFKDRGFEVGNKDYSEKQLFKSFQRYLGNDLKAKKFSKTLRNLVIYSGDEDDSISRISETITDVFNNWDGELLTRDGYKTLEILYGIEEDGINEQELIVKMILNLENLKKIQLEVDSFDSISLIGKDGSKMLLEEDLFNNSIYLNEEINSIDFKQNTWKVDNFDVNMRFISYEKEVRLFKYDEFGTKEYVEVSKNEKLKDTDTYLAVFNTELKKDLSHWLRNNPNYNFQEKNTKDFNDISVIYDLKLINSMEYEIKYPYMEVFVPESIRSEKIELIGGLKSDLKTYLSRELPSIFIPESIRNNDELEIKINNEVYKPENEVIKPAEYVQDFKTSKYEIKLNKDDIKITFHVEVDDSELTSHLAGNIGYDFTFSAGEIVWNDINPNKLNYEDLEDGYITGGHLYIPKEFQENSNKLNLFEFKKDCTQILMISNKANQIEKITVTPDKFDWVNEFSANYNSYRLTEPNSSHSGEEIKFTNYSHYNLNFRYFIKETSIKDLNWIVCIYKNVIKIYQYGNKKPKIGFEDNDIEWTESLIYLSHLIKNEKIKVEYINKLPTDNSSFNKLLLNEYFEIADNMTKKEIDFSLTSAIDEDNEITSSIPSKQSEYVQSIFEFRELPGERLLRYISKVGSGTVNSLREAIMHIANSDSLKDLQLQSYLKDNIAKETDRIIQNLSYLLHIELSDERWCIAKPSINLLPGLQNRAIITGSRNDFLLDKSFKYIKKEDSYSIHCIDNSGLLNHIKYLQNKDGSMGSVRVSSNNEPENFHSYQTFSPTTFMISEFESIKELEPLKAELGIEAINENTAYSYIGLTPTIADMVSLSSQKQIKKYEKPMPFDEFLFKFGKYGGWIQEFYKTTNNGQSTEEGRLYKIKTSFGIGRYYVKNNNKTHLVTKDIGQYSQMQFKNQNIIFYKNQLPGGVLIIPSYLKLPNLYHKALGFCTGTNPRTMYISNQEKTDLSPKMNCYDNVPQDLIKQLFEKKLNINVKYIDDYQEIYKSLKENNVR